MNISAIPALSDNYIWLILSQDGREAVVVDPGEAAPVLQTLKQRQCRLKAILITHHHHDHTDGVPELVQHTSARVHGPSLEARNVVRHPLKEGDVLTIPEIDARYHIIDIPGHTLGHIAFYGHGHLFSGDTLFAGGCGRVFEGTPEIMMNSLSKLSALPPTTAIYCGHEYTQANLAFASLVEPENHNIEARLTKVTEMRQKGEITLPSTIGLENATNPFLRCEIDAVRLAAEQYSGKKGQTPVDVFATIRAWKNRL